MPSATPLSQKERDALLREARGGPVRSGLAAGDAGGPARNAAQSYAGVAARSAGGRVEPPRTGGWFSGRGRRWRRVLLVVLAILLALLFLGLGKFLTVGSAVLSHERSVIGQLADLLFRRGQLKGERENRVNILLLAEGGEGHAGENLTDTIMLASFRPQEKDVAIMSIPRDLYVKIPDTELYTRINGVHAHGEQQRKGLGVQLIKQKIGEITGQPIHYVARIDFIAFKKIVDELGGVDITIGNSFYDFWHKISFPAGTEHMNGERALAYVRARYIEGSGGGDFKRAERTQQVLLAIRKNVFSVQTAVDLRALAGILETLKQHVATDFTLSDFKRLADLTRGISEDLIRTAVITSGPNGLLVGTTETLGGRPAPVLRPRNGTEQYDEIRAFATNIFTEAPIAPSPSVGATPATSSPVPSPEVSLSPGIPDGGAIADEQPTVDVRNGTTIVGMAARVAKRLEKQHFTVTGVGNATTRSRTRTIVVDRTGGKKPVSLAAVLSVLDVSTTVALPPEETLSADANFVVFLGSDVVEKFKR